MADPRPLHVISTQHSPDGTVEGCHLHSAACCLSSKRCDHRISARAPRAQMICPKSPSQQRAAWDTVLDKALLQSRSTLAPLKVWLGVEAAGSLPKAESQTHVRTRDGSKQAGRAVRGGLRMHGQHQGWSRWSGQMSGTKGSGGQVRARGGTCTHSLLGQP